MAGNALRVVKLYNEAGLRHVVDIRIPHLEAQPDVIVWRDRLFILANEVGILIYTEAFSYFATVTVRGSGEEGK